VGESSSTGDTPNPSGNGPGLPGVGVHACLVGVARWALEVPSKGCREGVPARAERAAPKEDTRAFHHVVAGIFIPQPLLYLRRVYEK